MKAFRAHAAVEPPLYSAVGVAIVGLTNSVPVLLSFSGEELPVSHQSSNFTSMHSFRTKAYELGRAECERMPSKSFFG